MPLFPLIKMLHFSHRRLNPIQTGAERLWSPLKIKLNNFTTVQVMTAKPRDFPKMIWDHVSVAVTGTST